MIKIVLVRFGPPVPIPQISRALQPHFGDAHPMAFPMPGAVVSVFNTESTVEQVTASIKEVTDEVPFFIFEFNPEGCQLPGELVTQISGGSPVERRSAQVQRPNQSRPARTMDEVLDKIADFGIESLTEEEKTILNSNRSEG